MACGVAWVSLGVSLGCTGGSGQTELIDDRQAVQPLSIRFALEVSSAAESPIYVLSLDEDDQPGWLRVFRGTERIYLRERCEIEDCARRGVVCGAAVPVIRELVEEGTIELVWDGTTSEVDRTSRCETRQQASPGTYVARFCYSREAQLEPGGGVGGRLIDPTCVDQPFTLSDVEVVLKI